MSAPHRGDDPNEIVYEVEIDPEGVEGPIGLSVNQAARLIAEGDVYLAMTVHVYRPRDGIDIDAAVEKKVL